MLSLVGQLVSPVAQAQSPAEDRARLLAELSRDAPPQVRDSCTMIGTLAGLVMQARQEGEEVQDVMAALGLLDPVFIGDLVDEAFAIPRFLDTADRDYMISQFRDIYMIICYQSLAPD